MTTQTLSKPVRYTYWRRFRCLFLFCLLLALPTLSGSWLNAASMIQAGTLPLDGTLPTPSPPPTGTGSVRVLHLAPFDLDSANTAIDICTQTGGAVLGHTNLVYLTYSDYVSLPPAPYDWMVATPGCGTVVLDLPPFLLQPSAALTLLIVGGGNQPLTSVLLVDRSGQSFSVYLPGVFSP